MAKIYNSEVTTKLANNAGIQQNIDKTPNELAEKIVPTFETNPQLLRFCNVCEGAISTGANVNIYTTPTDADFYLVAGGLSYSKLATDTMDSCSLTINLDKETSGTEFLRLAGKTLTEERQSISLSLTYPIKLKRNTNITVAKTAANGTVAASIMGYLVYNPNA